MLGEFTLIVPYYRNVEMLREQIRAWELYPPQVKIILVDDGSPEPAENILVSFASPELQQRVRLLRIDIDIPWNRGGARNLGTKLAETEWILHVDIDHVLPAESASALLKFDIAPKRWYRFNRYRIGTADETRKKDFKKVGLPNDVPFGKIHPHVDSYLCRTRTYWNVGGYDEDYSGCLGGGNPFLAFMEAAVRPDVVPDPMHLRVYTRSAIKDASDWALSRDSTEYSRRKRAKEAAGNTAPQSPIRFPWHEVHVGYPTVRNEFETLEQLAAGKSISRFGDGEMKLITGGAQIREPANKKLGEELKRVLRYPHENLIVGIPTMEPGGAKYPNWRKHAHRFAGLINPDVQYYSAFISRPDSAQWIATPEYAQAMVALWRDKRVAFVCEQTSKFYTLLQQTATNPHHIPCPHTETYAVADDIIKQVLRVNPDIALLSCGPAATVIAARLCEVGVHALDLGSMGGFMLKQLALGEDEPLESEA